MKFWRAFERLADGAVVIEWCRELGAGIERARPFLRLVNGLSRTYPCTNVMGCEHPHRVEEPQPGRRMAVCDGDLWCPPIPVEAKDLFVFAVDGRVLCLRIAECLGLSAPGNRKIAGARVERVGTFGPANSEVYLMFPSDAARMMREVERLFCAQPDPFVLLTPTGVHCSRDVESALRRQTCMHMALSRVVTVAKDGRFSAMPGTKGMLEAFATCCREGRGLAKTVERIDRNIEAVARRDYELEKEVSELRQFQADGFFKFALRVDGEDFKAFAVIMALGNRKAAADFLKVPHRTFYDQVEKWSARGKEYQSLVRWIDWRKRSGRKIKVRLEDSVQSGEPNDAAENPRTVEDVLDSISAADNRDYPAILAQVLGVLKEQNSKNWAAVRDELVDLIKEEVTQ
jgi:hypothetical protein